MMMNQPKLFSGGRWVSSSPVQSPIVLFSSTLITPIFMEKMQKKKSQKELDFSRWKHPKDALFR